MVGEMWGDMVGAFQGHVGVMVEGMAEHMVRCMAEAGQCVARSLQNFSLYPSEINGLWDYLCF